MKWGIIISKFIQITPTEDVLLLAYLKENLKNIPNSKLKSYLQHKQISVNSVATTKFDHKVLAGQVITISTSLNHSFNLPFDVIYEDNFIIAINKPSGLLSVASDGEKEKTAYRILKETYGKAFSVVHRLDRATSGVLIFAKSDEIANEFQENWDKVKTREYHAICEGIFKKKKGQCKSNLTETSTHHVFSSENVGKLAITDYEVLRENEKFSYVKIDIKTGRKNQIRVHMKELGHPIVGDKKYDATTNPLKRLCLHASVLEVWHPMKNEFVTISAKPDKKFSLSTCSKNLKGSSK